MLYQLSYASAKIPHHKIFRLQKARRYSHVIRKALQVDAKLSFEIRFSRQILARLNIKPFPHNDSIPYHTATSFQMEPVLTSSLLGQVQRGDAAHKITISNFCKPSVSYDFLQGPLVWKARCRIVQILVRT